MAKPRHEMSPVQTDMAWYYEHVVMDFLFKSMKEIQYK